MPKKKPKTQEQIDKDELYDYYKFLVPSTNRVIFNTQYKRIVESEPTWTAKQMLATLHYIVEHQGKEVTSLAIVPYWYNECKRYYAWLSDVKKSIRAFKQDTDVHTVHIAEKEDDVYV